MAKYGFLYLNFKDATSIEAGKPYIVKKLQVKDPVFTATDGTDGIDSYIGFGYASLIDGTTNNRWRTDFTNGTTTACCEFNADQLVNVTGYTLTSGNLSTSYDPTMWTLQAKQDSSDAWTIIDSRDATQNSGDALPASRTSTKDYDIATEKQGAYKYFRFEVTQNGGGTQMVLTNLALQCTGTAPANVENPTFTGVAIDAADPQMLKSKDGKVTFMGSYSPVSLAANDKTTLYIGSNDKLFYPNAAMTVNAFRALFTVDLSTADKVSAFVLNFIESEVGATGISLTPINSPNGEDSDYWYTLDGRRLSGKPTQRGVYVNNGRKVVIK